jgi:replication-associated recombination protein RarA
MSTIQDPWVKVKTYHGFAADQVISALQKEIRRNHAENACLLAYEFVMTSPAMEDYLWQRLKIIAVEDVGFGEPNAVLMVNALFQMLATFDRSVAERKLFAVHAVRYLCACQKDRSSDEMVNWIMHDVENEKVKAEIPDYALDMHTAAGQAKGRGIRHFLEEGSQTSPEKKDRDFTYRKRLLQLLESGELEK